MSFEIPERLKYARSRSGLTGPQIRERTGIGESSLSEFENGVREPSLSKLQTLAVAYRRSLAFFLGEGPIPQEVVLWRERPEKGAEEMEARFLRLCEQYHNLEIWTEEKTQVSLPSGTTKTSLSYYDAEFLAKQVRDTLKLGDHPALSLLTVLQEVCGVKIFHILFEPSGTAASSKSETFGAAILLNSKNVRWRRNFDLAHELFHLLTWDVYRAGKKTEQTSCNASGEEEKLANCFATNLLMPMEEIRDSVLTRVKGNEISFEDLFDVARQFDVSIQTLIWQLKNVKLIAGDDAQIKDLINRAEGRRSVLEERKDTKPSLLPERYKALAVKALRHGCFSVGRFAEYFDISRQEAMKYVEQEITEDEKISLAPA